MKKRTSIILSAILIAATLFAGCSKCEHQWKEATYIKPKTCTVCGDTEGKPLQSPYKMCSEWLDVFQEIFTDKFAFDETIDETNGDKLLIMYFNNPELEERFMDEVLKAAEAFDAPRDNGIMVRDEQELKTVFLCFKEDVVLTFTKNVDTKFQVVTNLLISAKNEITERIQAKYETKFSAFDVSNQSTTE